MADEPIGSAIVEIKADLEPLRQGLKAAEAEARRFDATTQRAGKAGAEAFKQMGQSTAAAMKEARAASGTLGEAQTAAKMFSDTLKTLGQDAGDAGDAIGINAQQVDALSRTLSGTVRLLMAGASPFKILRLQAGNLMDALSGGGGVGGAIGNIVSGIGRLPTPIKAVALSIGALGAAGIYALNQWNAGQRETEVALAGIGRASMATVENINRIAFASSSAFGLSVSEARAAANAFAATGAIGVQSIQPLVALTRDFAATLGMDAVAGAKLLAQAIAEPGKGADTLGQKMGILNDAQRQQIRYLSESGAMLEAQALLVDAVRGSVVEASRVTGFWTTAWTGLKNAVVLATSSVGEFLADFTGVGITIEREIGIAQQRLAQMEVLGGGKWTAEIERTKAEIARLTAEIEKNSEKAEQSRLNQLSKEIGDLGRAISPEVTKLEQMSAQLVRLGQALENPDITSNLASIAQVTDAYERTAHAVETYITAINRQVQSMGLQAQMAGAVTAQERASIQLKQFILSLAGQSITVAEREALIIAKKAQLQAQVDGQRAKAMLDLTQGAEQSIARLEHEVDMLGKSAYEVDRLSMEYNLLAAAKEIAAKSGGPQGISDEELMQIQALAQRYADLRAQLRAAGDEGVSASNARIAALNAEAAAASSLAQTYGSMGGAFGSYGNADWGGNSGRQMSFGLGLNEAQQRMAENMWGPGGYDTVMTGGRRGLGWKFDVRPIMNQTGAGFVADKLAAEQLAALDKLLAKTGSVEDAITKVGSFQEMYQGFGWKRGLQPETVISSQEKFALQKELASLTTQITGDPTLQIQFLEDAIEAIMAQPMSLERMRQLAALTSELEALRRSTDGLNDTMLGLSDYYTRRPDQLFGFLGFEKGGIMTSQGALPLKKYSGGGIANSPQLAMFGEGRVPEAYVPVPSGKIPVELNMPTMPAPPGRPEAPGATGLATAAAAVSARTEININAPLINFASEPTVDELRQTAYQAAAEMRNLMSTT